MGLFDGLTNLFDTASSDISNQGNVGFVQSVVGGLDTGVQPFPVTYLPSYNVTPGAEMAPMAPGPMLVGSGQRSVSLTAAGIPPLLFKIAQALGLTHLPTVPYVLAIFRKLSKFLSPAAIAAALGLQVAELAMILTYGARKKRRRMNVANVRALRRGVRRLKGFERLANRVSVQLSRTASRGRSRSRTRCITCRKSPCVC